MRRKKKEFSKRQIVGFVLIWCSIFVMAVCSTHIFSETMDAAPVLLCGALGVYLMRKPRKRNEQNNWYRG